MIIESIVLIISAFILGAGCGAVGYRLFDRRTRRDVVVWRKKPSRTPARAGAEGGPRPRQRNVSVQPTSRGGKVVSGRETIMKSRRR